MSAETRTAEDTITAVRVAVLMGGKSAEREVSLNTGRQVADALSSIGMRPQVIDTAGSDFISRLEQSDADVCFIALHGRFGEDGTVQGMLELLGIPYAGSGVLASALAMDKVMSKLVFERDGIPTPPWVRITAGQEWNVEEITAELGPKTVVKPANEGSSVGMTIVHSPAELPAGIELALSYDGTVVVERFIAGTEVTIGVLGNAEVMPLPTLEIVPEHEFYDYESKYLPGMSTHIIPARVPEVARTECQRLAVEAHKALGCRGMSRSDTIVAEDGSIYLLEVNTIPGMTKTSLLPDAARAAGIEFPELCRMLVGFALEAGGTRR